VGFIRDLPHGLIDTFEATLQEAADADLLLHVVDASSPEHAQQMQEVLKVLVDIGADRVPQVLVFNKLDAVEPQRRPRRLVDSTELPDPDGSGARAFERVFVSAQTGLGLGELRQLLLRHARAGEADPPALLAQGQSPALADGLV
jgi:GTP-binding protein HflX